MIDLSIELQGGDAVAGWIRTIYRDQLPFVEMRAVNATAFDVRDAQRAHIQSAFTVRRPWVAKAPQIPRGGKATKQKPEARVELADNRGFLAKFERGGTLMASDSIAHPFAIPTDQLRPVKTAVVPRRFLPKNLRLQPRKDVLGTLRARQVRTKRGVIQWKGKRRTFILDPRFHNTETWGVFQRTGPKRNQIRLLWAYRQKITIPPLLHFVDTAQRVVPEVWDRNFTKWFDRAIKSARRTQIGGY